MTEKFANAAQTTLASAMLVGDLTLSVASAALFPTSGTFRLIIGSELLTVTSVSGTTFTVTRGAEGSVAAAHASASLVTAIITAAALEQLKTDAAGVRGAVVTAPNWYIDPVGGVDSAAGTAIGTPLKTWAGLRAKWGLGVTLTVIPFVTVHILGDLPQSDPIILRDIHRGPDTNLVIKGEYATAVRTGSFTSVTTLAPATNQADQIIDSGMAGTWTADLSMRVRCTTAGANLNQVAWVAKDLGTKTARMSAWALIDPPASTGYHGPTPGSVSVGNAYVVERLTSCFLDTTSLLTRAESTNVTHPGRIYIVDLDVNTGNGNTVINEGVLFLGCRVVGVGVDFARSTGGALVNCCAEWITARSAGASVLAGLLLSGGAGAFESGFIALANGALTQGGDLYADYGGLLDVFSAGVFDSPDSGVYLENGGGVALRVAGPLYGSGNTLFGAQVGALNSVAILVGVAAVTVTGASGQVTSSDGVGTWPVDGLAHVIPAWGGGPPVTRVIRNTAVPSTITTADDLVRVTAAALQTLPAAPSNGHSYEVYNATSGNNDVNGGGHNIDTTGAATMTLGPKQAVTFTYCLASTSWMAT